MADHTHAGDAVRLTRAYMDSILVEERLIDAGIPDLRMELFGESFDSPIMTPAFSHLRTFVSEQEDAMSGYSLAAAQMNAVNWTGMCENEEFERIIQTGARTVRVIKPYVDRGKVFDQIGFAESHGALAVGVDIDHVFGDDGTYDCVMGEMMTRQTADDLKAYAAATTLPFVVKGVLSVSDALKCAEAGVKGIVVSHHHGRMPFAIPPLMALPEIAARVRGSGMKIFVDCGMDSGIDAFKALALGADAVSAGRVLLPALTKDGTEGVKNTLKRMNDQLRMMMAYTGCGTLADIQPSLLWLGRERMSDLNGESRSDRP